jgi:amidase
MFAEGEATARAMLTAVACETRAEILAAGRLAGRRPRHDDFEAATYALGLLGAATGAEEYVAAWRHFGRVGRELGRFFARYDVLLTPTLASPPLPIGHLSPTPGELALLGVVNRLGAGWALKSLDVAGPLAARLFDFMPYTPLCNLTGLQAMLVPLHWTPGGLPVGMQFAAPYGDEAILLRLAGQLELARPWAECAPPGIN